MSDINEDQVLGQKVHEFILTQKGLATDLNDIYELVRQEFWIELTWQDIVQAAHEPMSAEAVFRAQRRFALRHELRERDASLIASIERGFDNGLLGIIMHWVSLAKFSSDIDSARSSLDFLEIMVQKKYVGRHGVPNALLYAYMRSMSDMDAFDMTANERAEFMADKMSQHRTVVQAMGKDQERRDIHNAICHWAMEEPEGEWGDLLRSTVEKMWREDKEARFRNAWE